MRTPPAGQSPFRLTRRAVARSTKRRTDSYWHKLSAVCVCARSGSESDLADALERLLPVQDVYRHRHGSLGHGRYHVLPAFVAPSLTIPVLGGRPALGTWQHIALVDVNVDNTSRSVRLSFLAG